MSEPNPHDWPDPWPEWADALAVLAEREPLDLTEEPPF